MIDMQQFLCETKLNTIYGDLHDNEAKDHMAKGTALTLEKRNCVKKLRGIFYIWVTDKSHVSAHNTFCECWMVVHEFWINTVCVRHMMVKLAWGQRQWDNMCFNSSFFEYDLASVVARVFLFDISDDECPIIREFNSTSLLKYCWGIKIVQVNDGQEFVSVSAHLTPFDWSDVWSVRHIQWMENESLTLVHRPLGEVHTC